MADYYMTGSVQLTNGSKAVTGIDTAWVIAQVAGGTIFVQAEGNPLPLASIESDTAATAALEWSGATGTYAYALLRATAFSEQLETNSNILSRLLVAMEAGTLYRYDVAGDTTDLAIYAERPAGFAFLAIDVNPAELYIKASAASGDWAGPFSYGQGEQGDEGPPGPAAVFNWRGAYSGATTYSKNDGVRGSGRSFVSLQDGNVGHALPVFPATTNAWWDLTAEKGADGAGTGDVAGPAGATDWDLVFFNGATGKLIRSVGAKAALDAFRLGPVFGGPPAEPSNAGVGLADGDFNTINYAGLYTIAGSWANGPNGAGAATYTGILEVRTRRYANFYVQYIYLGSAVYRRFTTTAGGLSGWSVWTQVDLSVGTTAGTVAAGDDARFGQGGKNDALLALEIADLKGSRMGMAGGIADAFDDEAGVNTGGSTNQGYDAANDWYAPVVSGGSTVGSSATSGGAATSTAYTVFDRSFSIAAGTVVQKLGVYSTLAGTGKIKIGLQTSSTQFDIVTEIAMAHPGGGWYDVALSTPYTVPGTGTYNIAAYFATGGSTSGFPSALRSYKAGDVTGSAQGGFSADTNGIYPVRASYGAVTQNMTLVSIAYTAASAPSTARIALQLVEIDTITINTHVTAEATRDGGTTWTAVALSLSTNLSGVKVYEGVASISSQPSGTSMRWRIKTLSNKNVDVSGVVMQWS
jgi:hypothetical protein